MSSEESERFPEFEQLFWQVSRKMGYVWTKIYEEVFPGSQSYIMFMLEQRGATRMSKMAETLHLTPGAVTTASDKLIERGFVTRVRDEQDRRVVYLDITDDGSKLLSELRDEGRAVMRTVFAHLTEAELDQLIHVFGKASHNIEKIDYRGKELDR
ncbi:putative HTH-type transcriptional regulator YhbI [Lentibacillus sp. JNUCC-1]|uniref:MarR family winged helix-turn-helix transcriptional regulator n=1 Tax=Lentibacillus sp. JNUCC-1 TaxID=2654513 RepID=UPI0012E72778|nr:MarR family transcriptional regulator [Lentibacillus sp. JNUCC-1]MUV37636.1 putative HTH-type transcriptional regulator YhbI [Lentibacillus sp. JNUCC-1]